MLRAEIHRLNQRLEAAADTDHCRQRIDDVVRMYLDGLENYLFHFGPESDLLLFD